MDFRSFRRMRVLAVSLTTVTATTTLFTIAGTAGPASAATSGACPGAKSLGGYQTASNVSAGFSDSGNNTIEYTFTSLQNENPVDGVPGLIKYCVYTSPQPATVVAEAKGENGRAWIARAGRSSFSFVRPDGNKSNIPLDGTSTVMGTASWTAPPPADQTILLHINDPTVCHSLYGSDSPDTCFVKPSPPGPDCTHGDATVAYNAMPFDVVNCLNPSLGFEATATNEFGDEVGLAGTGRQLVSLNVLFASFACQAGHWDTGDCVSATGATFDHPITANIYAANDSTSPPSPGALLATVTVNQTIPYRPSADPVNCTGANAGQWFNPLAPGGGACQNQISTVLTFTGWQFTAAWTGSLPDHVIWTVAFNTTHYGYSPIGESASCFGSAGGCPYDSLNVGAKSYPGAPYAGTDINADEAFLSTTTGGVAGPLQADSGWSANRPLGEIITAQ